MASGFELAKQFAEHGFDLLVNSNGPGLAPAAEQLGAAGTRVQAVQADCGPTTVSSSSTQRSWESVGP